MTAWNNKTLDNLGKFCIKKWQNIPWCWGIIGFISSIDEIPPWNITCNRQSKCPWAKRRINSVYEFACCWLKSVFTYFQFSFEWFLLILNKHSFWHYFLQPLIFKNNYKNSKQSFTVDDFFLIRSTPKRNYLMYFVFRVHIKFTLSMYCLTSMSNRFS